MLMSRLAFGKLLGSLAWRIAVACVVFGSVVAAGTVAVGVRSLSRQLDERAALEMQGRKELLSRLLSQTPTLAAAGDSSDRFADLFFGHQDLHLALSDPGTGRLVAAFSEVAAQSVTAQHHSQSAPDALHTWVTVTGQRFSGWHGTVALADGQPITFYLSLDRHHDIALLDGFVQSTLLALPVLLVVVAIGAGIIAATGMAPVRRFNGLAASIGTKTLNRRVVVTGLPSELQDMATEFNGMLKRIDEGYQQLEEFAGNLAHEMRTPVATLLGRTQVALSRSRSAQEMREVLEGNVDELERLTTLIADMLFIARADHGTNPMHVDAVELKSEARQVAEYLSLVAEEKEVAIHVIGEAQIVSADRLQTQRAITNLVSNAIRHANARSVIVIEISCTKDATRMSVKNEGPAIAKDHMGRIFDRFFRADLGRSRDSGGSGLGLAIVQSIMQSHGGDVGVSCDAGYTTFSLSFRHDGLTPKS